MSEMIRDGAGKGFLAKVNKDNQLTTRAIAVEQRLKSAVNEEYFEATTGKINLSNSNNTGIIFLSNTGFLNIIIDRVFYDIFDSTSGVGSGTLTYIINPTSSGGSAATVTNTNFGSSKTLSATVTKSPTLSGGTVWWTAQILPATSTALEEGRIVISPGSTFGIKVQAPGSNSSMDISLNIAMYNLDSELL